MVLCAKFTHEPPRPKRTRDQEFPYFATMEGWQVPKPLRPQVEGRGPDSSHPRWLLQCFSEELPQSRERAPFLVVPAPKKTPGMPLIPTMSLCNDG